jgi:hypothetical protein
MPFLAKTSKWFNGTEFGIRPFLPAGGADDRARVGESCEDFRLFDIRTIIGQKHGWIG